MEILVSFLAANGMGVKLRRKKPGNFLVKTMYLMSRLLPMSSKTKFRLFLNMEWIFSRFSHEYSHKYYNVEGHPARKYTKEFLLEMIQSDQVVLDLGCNNGFMTDYISEKAREVVGIDQDPKELVLAKSTYKRDNLSFQCVEGYKYLSETDKKFDVLILSHVLEHLDEPSAFLGRFKSFFKYIYIEVPDFDMSLLNQYRNDLGLSLIYTDHDHVTEFDRAEMSDLVTRNHLKILKAEYRFGLQRLWLEVEN